MLLGPLARPLDGFPAPQDPKKVLLIKLGAIGDLVIASPFFHEFRKHYPNTHTVLLIGKSCAQAVVNNPSIDRFIKVDDNALYNGPGFRRIKEFIRLILLLRKEKFDQVFVMHRAWQFNLLAFLAGIPSRVGFARGNEGIMLNHHVVPIPSRNEREVYLDLLRVMKIPAEYERTYFYLSEEEQAALPKFLAETGIREDEIVIAVAPGGGDNVKSSMPSKRWPVENFSRLLKTLMRERPCRALLVGGPGDREILARIQEENPDCIDTTHLTIGEIASVFRRCSLFIGNDSGPLHIASSSGIPTIALFGPTNPEELASPGANNTVLFKKVECGPCFDSGDFPECDHLTCLRSITVEEVLAVAKNALPRMTSSKKPQNAVERSNSESFSVQR